MSKDTNPIRPNGVNITITETDNIIVYFDHGEIPPVLLSIKGATQVGSHIASAADNARRSTDEGGRFE